VLTESKLSLLPRIRRLIPVLFILNLLDRPLTESEIAGDLQMNLETVRAHLRQLSQEGLVSYLGRNKGWIILPLGRQFLIPFPSPDLISTAENPGLETQPDVSENAPSPGKSAVQAGKIKITAENPGLETQPDASENAPSRGKSAVQAGKIKITAENPQSFLEEEDLNLKNLNLDSPPPSKPEPQTLNVRAILQSVKELLGEPIKGSPKHFKDPARLLGWIAYAHHNRQGLHYPARLVFRRCHSDHELEQPYLERPSDYLPNWFLEQIGLRVEDPPEDDCEDDSDLDFFDDLDDEHPPPENPHLSPQAARWWEACFAKLQFELPRPTFNNWVKSLYAFSWDEDGALFTLAIPNQYARDWLDSRLKTTIQQHLTAIANRALTVQIISHPLPYG
jgi:hypothetical protein